MTVPAVWSRLQADPHAAAVIAFVGRWWWVGLLAILVIALLPRRS